MGVKERRTRKINLNDRVKGQRKSHAEGEMNENSEKSDINLCRDMWCFVSLSSDELASADIVIEM